MQVLRELTRNPSPKGISHGTLERAAKRIGLCLTVVLVPYVGRKTMARWTADNKAMLAEAPHILCVGNHYVTVHGRRFNDNWTKTPIALKKAHMRRCRVRYAWRVAAATEPVAPVVITSKPALVADVQRPARDKARALAREHGIEITVGDPLPDCIWVAPPEGCGFADPHEGDHYVYDWRKALGRVQDYVEVLTRTGSDGRLDDGGQEAALAGSGTAGGVPDGEVLKPLGGELLV
jgi:hypothetical protein